MSLIFKKHEEEYDYGHMIGFSLAVYGSRNPGKPVVRFGVTVKYPVKFEGKYDAGYHDAVMWRFHRWIGAN